VPGADVGAEDVGAEEGEREPDREPLGWRDQLERDE
jgi:hypothetical protein